VGSEAGSEPAALALEYHGSPSAKRGDTEEFA
jgi:hypothetical protein